MTVTGSPRAKLILVTLLLVLLPSAEGIRLKRSQAPAVAWSNFPFNVFILGVDSNNTIQQLCSGSILNLKGISSHILTSAYCIQNFTDPTAPGKFLTFKVMVPDPKGAVLLGGHTFTAYTPLQRFLHPLAGQLANFTFLSAFPNGSSTFVSGTIDINDVGIVRLTTLITTSGAAAVSLATFIPVNASTVSLLGFGAPSFYTLHKADSLIVIPSVMVVSGVDTVNNNTLFLRDYVDPQNATEAVEIGDEGGAIVQGSGGNLYQVAIAQGSWISTNNNQTITFASFGPTVASYHEFINGILTESYAVPTSTNTTSDSSPLVPVIGLILGTLFSLLM